MNLWTIQILLSSVGSVDIDGVIDWGNMVDVLYYVLVHHIWWTGCGIDLNRKKTISLILMPRWPSLVRRRPAKSVGASPPGFKSLPRRNTFCPNPNQGHKSISYSSPLCSCWGFWKTYLYYVINYWKVIVQTLLNRYVGDEVMFFILNNLLLIQS